MDARDYFELFGLEPKLSLDRSDLEQRFYGLSRKLHPDRFLRATPAVLETSASLNDAYRTLRDPVSRAEYLLKRQGLEAGDARQASPETLEEVFALNEALEELRNGSEDARPQVEAARERFLGLLRDADRELDALARRYDEGDPTAAGELRALLNRRRYIANLLSHDA
jgi:molecular chaperone HscB